MPLLYEIVLDEARQIDVAGRLKDGPRFELACLVQKTPRKISSYGVVLRRDMEIGLDLPS